jgi:hypothetical protein
MGGDMMWIVLTKLNGDALLVPSDKLTHMIGRKEGGSSLYLASMDGREEGRQRTLSVQESLSEIEKLLMQEEAEPAIVKAPKRGRRG